MCFLACVNPKVMQVFTHFVCHNSDASENDVVLLHFSEKIYSQGVKKNSAPDRLENSKTQCM